MASLFGLALNLQDVKTLICITSAAATFPWDVAFDFAQAKKVKRS